MQLTGLIIARRDAQEDGHYCTQLEVAIRRYKLCMRVCVRVCEWWCLKNGKRVVSEGSSSQKSLVCWSRARTGAQVLTNKPLYCACVCTHDTDK